MSTSEPTPAEGLRLLRRHHAGVLAFGERVCDLRFVLDRRDGRLVSPVEPAVFDALEHVLFLPDQAEAQLQVLLTPEPLDEVFDESRDRWAAYHGDPPARRWARCIIETAKTDRWVFDGAALMEPSELTPFEPSLVRELNARRADVAELCRRSAGVEIGDPLVVGVDPDGVDVRARFGIVRIEFSQRASDADAARDQIRRLLEESAA